MSRVLILHRALVGEVLRTCAAVSVILLAIFWVARLMGFLRQAVAGDIPADSVLILLLLKTLTYLDILAPLVLYVSTLLVLGRWIRDNELAVLNACGVGMRQLIAPAMMLFAIIGIPAAAFSLYLSPLSAQASRAVVDDMRARADVSGVVAGTFQEIRGRNSVYFVERFADGNDNDGGDNGNGNDNDNNGGGGGKFRDIFFYDGDVGELVVAQSGGKRSTNGDDYLVLKNGRRYQAQAGFDDYARLDFDEYGLRLKSTGRGTRAGLPIKATPTWKLLAGGRAAIGELHWRIGKVVSLAVLMIFALAFSSMTYRAKRFPGLLPALLVYFAYSNVLGFGVALIRRGTLHAHFGLWAIHLIFLAAAIYLLHRRNANKPLLPRMALRRGA